MDADEASVSWREVWAGAVAINELCVKKEGKSGTASNLGKWAFLFTSFFFFISRLPFSIATVTLTGGGMECAGLGGKLQLQLGP